MTLTLVCHCGTKTEVEAPTFAEIRTEVAARGWEINAPTCPTHTPEEQS